MTQPTHLLKRCASATILAGLLVACAATPQVAPETVPEATQPATTLPAAPQTAQTQPAPATPTYAGPRPGDPVGTPGAPPYSGPTGPFTNSGNAKMDAWREDFAARARYQGRNPAVVYAILEGISPLDIYLGDNDRSEVANQAEFSKAVWEYLATAVTDARFETGQQKLAELSSVFDVIEQTYGVDREAVSAIWAMETNFGGYTGNYRAANTLANMAVEGRRQSFAESQLIALMKMVENGYARVDQLGSGWAGAMGHTQFMPTTYLAYAQDYDGDGLSNVWTYPPDALASAAHYLSVSGYRFGEPWGVEVLAPGDFDWSMADGNLPATAIWRIKHVDGQIVAATHGRGVWTIPLDAVHSSADEDEAVPDRFELTSVFPNPFMDSATIEFTLARAGHANVSVFDLSGRRVTTLVDEERSAGVHRVEWNAGNLAAGSYLVRLSGASGSDVRSVVRVR